jgi:hypothetical protein
VTLLPRHWEWLDAQPGGASVALRKLIETVRRGNHDQERLRRGQEALHRFMFTIAGNLPGFEEAARALYRKDKPRFNELIENWPGDIREHATKLALRAFPNSA